MSKFPVKDAGGQSRTPYAVHCLGPWDMPGGGCGLVYLTEEQYNRQMARPDYKWRCPHCRYEADWSDDNYDEMIETWQPDAADSENCDARKDA